VNPGVCFHARQVQNCALAMHGCISVPGQDQAEKLDFLGWQMHTTTIRTTRQPHRNTLSQACRGCLACMEAGRGHAGLVTHTKQAKLKPPTPAACIHHRGLSCSSHGRICPPVDTKARPSQPHKPSQHSHSQRVFACSAARAPSHGGPAFVA